MTGPILRRISTATLYAVCALLLAPTNGFAAWALDRAWDSNLLGGSGTTVTFTYSGAVAAGAMLKCYVGAGTASSGIVSGISDSVNGAWILDGGTGVPVTTGAQDWAASGGYFLNSAAGTPVVTATFTSSSSSRTIVCGSYTGVATSSAFDVGKGNGQTDPGTGADAVTTGATSATAQSNELAISFVLTQSSVNLTANGTWTQRFNAAIGSNFTMGVQDKNIASASTVTATWTVDNAAGDTESIVGVFKAAGSATRPPQLPLTHIGRRTNGTELRKPS
jgi:hypothetical protein